MCLANNRYGTRCGSWEGIRIEDRPMVGKLLAELKRLDFGSRPSFCVHKLLTFTNLAVCRYQRKGIRAKVNDLLEQRHLERPYDNGLCKYLPLFLPYRPPESAHLTVNEFVVRQAMEPFDTSTDPENELGKGYLYVYWNEATFGIRKIGFTTNEVSDRLKAWETDCNHVAKLQYSSPSKVRHAARVEQLVHADLLDYRVFEPACRCCLKSHIEWFRGVNLSFIIKRIEAWTDWIGEGPYEKVERTWRLTEKGRERMPLVTDANSCREPAEHVNLSAVFPRRYNFRSTKGRKPSSLTRRPKTIGTDRMESSKFSQACQPANVENAGEDTNLYPSPLQFPTTAKARFQQMPHESQFGIDVASHSKTSNQSNRDQGHRAAQSSYTKRYQYA